MSRKTRERREGGVPGDSIGEAGQDRYREASDDATTSAGHMSLGELTEAARVSVRTVRYYIAEGLLPPPEGTGPGSAYTRGHLDRLRLIQRLKEAYLPLKEIRRRLSGLSDDDVERLLADEDQRATSMPLTGSELTYDESLSGAREYLALLESRERYQTEPMALQFPAADRTLPAAEPEAAAAPEPVRNRANLAKLAVPARNRREHEHVPPNQASGLWHRIPLGDEAELVISDRVYARHRDRIDWLVRWARKVFG